PHGVDVAEAVEGPGAGRLLVGGHGGVGVLGLLDEIGQGSGLLVLRERLLDRPLVDLLVEGHGREAGQGLGVLGVDGVEVLVDDALLGMPAGHPSQRHVRRPRRASPLDPASSLPSAGASGRGGPPPSSPSSRSARRATDTRWSPSSSWISRTPCVLRPMVEISAVFRRMIIPFSVMSITCSSACRNLTPTTGPLRPVVLMSMIPLPPRLSRRYSSMPVPFPNPFPAPS